jgi:hypothetical protein
MRIFSIIMGAACIAGSLLVFNTGLGLDSEARYFYFLFSPVVFVTGAALLIMEDD